MEVLFNFCFELFGVSVMIGILAVAASLVIVYGIHVVRKKKYQQTEYFKQTQAEYENILGDTGKLGEYYTSEKLKSLDGYKKYLFNCYLPKVDGETTEIDVILLHESGIYVFESKNYSGWIFGDEDSYQWTQSLSVGKGKTVKKRFLNPIIQNKVHLKWLREYLGIEKSWPLYSYIVFSERCELKKVAVTSKEHHVTKRENLLQEVRRNITEVGTQLSKDEIDSLYDKLYPLTQVDEVQKLVHIEKIQQKQESKKEKVCPWCGGKLVVRTATKGDRVGKAFWGCSNYPKCKFIENIEE